MSYTVVNTFKEKHDDDRVYEAGKPYPQGDFKPTKKRIEELSAKHAEYGVVFIKEEKPKEEKAKKTKKKE